MSCDKLPGTTSPPGGTTVLPGHAWNDLRPGILCISTILLLLGSFLTLVALLAIALRAPDAIYVHQVDEFRSVVIGGEGLGNVIPRVISELGTAVLLTLSGGLGVFACRGLRFSQDPYTRQGSFPL
jgi:hypothetical protein